MSLRKVIEGAGLALNACADVLGVDHELFQQWADSQKEIPPSYALILAATLGVKADVLTSRVLASTRGSQKIEPAAIWFKFRGAEFTDADRESILAIRRLGHNANELEQSTLGHPNRRWDPLFQTIMQKVDVQASPHDQGRIAAKAFCEMNEFGQGGKGSADFLRDRLRAQGILLIESPIEGSQVEGCSFYVGDSSAERPCIFVNTYKSTWFRRNVIIMHEVGHALFDKTSGGEIDIVTTDSILTMDKRSLVEVRAQAFAQETLLPKKLLVSLCASNGLIPRSLTSEGLATLVADSGIEKKTVVEALFDNSLIDDVLAQQYLSYDIAQTLRDLTPHALSTVEYIEKIGKEAASAWENKRITTATRRKLLLPVPYVKSVLEAVQAFNISISRAADLLMIDEYTFADRFADLLAGVTE